MGAEKHQPLPGDPAALADRLFRDLAGALELLTIYQGERLGLYQALHAGGPATSAELAARTGTAERYIREWLEHHAVSGLLEVDDPAAGPLARRYTLPPGHVPVLADTSDVRYQAFSGTELVRAARWMPQVAEAARSGGAPPPLSWAPEGRPEFNRAVFLNLLGRQWLPAIADVDLRLRSEPPARVADLACGTGWSSIATAQAYPLISVDGFDLDADAIEAARGGMEAASSSPTSGWMRNSPRPPPSRSSITTPGVWSPACPRSWATRKPPRPAPCCDPPRCAVTPGKPDSAAWKSSRSTRRCCGSTG
jgi:Methyltransferase small domain